MRLMPLAVEFFRSVPRWLLVRMLARRWTDAASGALSCIHLIETPPPALPSPEWVRILPRLSGICGSDLSAIACKGSPYFSPFVSTPFVPGHEVAGSVAEKGAAVPAEWKLGQRVVIEPALSCQVRGISPPCTPCGRGHYAHCENILRGTIQGGIQTGYCSSTGGGWSAAGLVAHHSQLHAVPDNLSDELAVLAEPYACSIHAALKAPLDANATILVLGCGSIGLLAISAYRQAGGKARVLAVARHQHQAKMAETLGADRIFRGRGSEALYRWTLDQTGGGGGGGGGGIYHPEIGKPVLLGGVDAVLDCVGSSESIDDALRLARPRGLVILAGMPGIPAGVDWTSIWYKELRVQGAYAYGWEEWPSSDPFPQEPRQVGSGHSGRRVKTMQLALEYLQRDGQRLKELVNRRFPLQGYRTALHGAWHAGASGAFKTVFEVANG